MEGKNEGGREDMRGMNDRGRIDGGQERRGCVRCRNMMDFKTFSTQDILNEDRFPNANIERYVK